LLTEQVNYEKLNTQYKLQQEQRQSTEIKLADI